MTEERMRKARGKPRWQVLGVVLLVAAGGGWLFVLFLTFKGPEWGSPGWVVDRTLAALCGLRDAKEELARYYGCGLDGVEESLRRTSAAQQRTGLALKFLHWEIKTVRFEKENRASVNVLADVVIKYGRADPLQQRLNLLYRLRKEDGRWRIVR